MNLHPPASPLFAYGSLMLDEVMQAVTGCRFFSVTAQVAGLSPACRKAAKAFFHSVIAAW